jgi:two-component system copper resistance phosphate regulon response regulator CusR
MRVLLVEDEEKVSELVATSLRAEGFAVDVAADGEAGLALAEAQPYDIVLLDIMLPRMSGTDVLRGIRRKNRQVPILMLTAKDAVAEKIMHLDTGADDYLTKPFSSSELFVRIRALLRRAPEQKSDVLRVDDLEVDRLARQVRRGGKRIELSAKEYALLEYLALNAGRSLSRAAILENVWGQSFEGLTNVVDVYIRYLRGKIDAEGRKKLIKTVRGIGYALDAED